MIMWKLSRLFWTIYHLKYSQILYRIRYKFLPVKYKKLSFEKTQLNIELNNSIPAYNSYNPDDSSFTFLNLTKSFDKGLDWNYAEFGKLWTYNLNYFDFLNQASITKEQGVELINQYIEELSEVKDGLEPYPVSLRIINWIKFLAEHKINNKSYNDVIYSHANFLSNNLEYHLLGNHLLENAFALLISGVYLTDNKLLDKAKQILSSELKEQVLNDGAHFELSPMYHSIILYRILDAINLLEKNNDSIDSIYGLLKTTASKMLSWLEHLSFNDGDIPLFNDSVLGIAPSYDNLFSYANQLNIEYPKGIFDNSGYHKLKSKHIETVVKGGDIGPDYIPGHAHADTFSFVTYLKGIPFIIDTGVSTYEPGELRLYQRSTQAHNTVSIKELNSSDVWSTFRVGTRAKSKTLVKEVNKFVASHNGYSQIHERTFEISDSTLTIKDRTMKESPHPKKAILHFDPDVCVEKLDSLIVTNHAHIQFKNAISVDIHDCNIAREYNKLIPSKKAVITFENNLETKIIVDVKNN